MNLGEGVAGNCDRVGDYLVNLNPDINYKCVADASGWIPLPLKNTENCNNDQRERESTQLGFKIFEKKKLFQEV